MSLPKTIIHLLSGGLDSVVMLYDLVGQGHKVHCAIFDYGQSHARRELPLARFHCDRLKVGFTELKIPTLRGSSITGGGSGVIVPNRNAVLLNIAVALAVNAKADTVTYACNADDEAVFPDCRMAFVQTLNNMLVTQQINVEVCAPYIDKKKWWIVGLGQEMGVPLKHTWSCYLGGDTPCGTCPACLKRHEALHGHSQDQCACAGKY